MYIVVGLGNPGKEYERTRHNAGRRAVEFVSKNLRDGGETVKIFTPDTFMNVTGPAVAKAIAGKGAEKLIVIYDDIDLPLGSLKVSFDRGSGGHNGVESIIKALKTKEFIRIRIGIVPVSIFGKMKKPKGEQNIEKFILGEFKKSEEVVLEKVFERALEAVKMIIEKGVEPAMTEFNR